MNKNISIPHGFTLIEMIVATLLLAIGVAASVAAISSTVRLQSHADNIQTASLLAQQKLTEIDLQLQDQSGQTGSASSSQQNQGDFSPDHPDFRWKENLQPTSFSDLVQVSVTIDWGAQGSSSESRVFTTYFNTPSQSGGSQNGSSSSGTAGGQSSAAP